MKNIKKYISVVVIAIAMTITFSAINTNKTNNSVKMQNKEALATKPVIYTEKICCEMTSSRCVWYKADRFTPDYSCRGEWY